MEQNITIQVPEGKVIEQTIESDGSIKITFVDPKPIQSKSWEEFCENHPNVSGEYSIGPCGVIEYGSSYKRSYEYNGNNLLATKEDAEGISAFIKLVRLHDEWVGDWKPVYGNPRIYNWNIWYSGISKSFCVETTTRSHRVLQFPSSKMANDFLFYFNDLLLAAKKFI